MSRKTWICGLASVLAIALLVVAPVVEAKSVRFRVAWDAYPPEPPIDLKYIHIYKRDPGGKYDYTAPFKTVPQTMTTAGSTPSITEYLYVDAPDGGISKFLFVARAEGATPDRQSPDSVEVAFDVDLRALLATTDLQAVYNATLSAIDFTWSPSDPDRTKMWRLYQSNTSAGPWTEIDSIDWDGVTTTLTTSQSIAAPAGVVSTYYFVIVAFGQHSVASPNSNVVAVTVDRRETPAIINLRVIVD